MHTINAMIGVTNQLTTLKYFAERNPAQLGDDSKKPSPSSLAFSW